MFNFVLPFSRRRNDIFFDHYFTFYLCLLLTIYVYFAGSGAMYRDYVISLGLIRHILKFINMDLPVTALRHHAKLITNLCRFKDPPLNTKVVAQLLPTISALLDYTDTEVSL